jgi:hypothetical protein
MSVFALAIICVLVLVPIGIVLKPTKKTAVEKTKPAARLPKSKSKLVNELTEKQLEDFYHLAEQILDDSEVSHKEAKQLQRWFAKYPAAEFDFNTRDLFSAINDALDDGVFDEDEENEVFTLLTEFTESFEDDESDGEVKTGQVVGVVDLEINHQYRMTYKDASNNISDRSIIIKSLSEKDGRQYLKAVCMKKHAVRTFRVDRIQELFSIETGEALV